MHLYSLLGWLILWFPLVASTRLTDGKLCFCVFLGAVLCKWACACELVGGMGGVYASQITNEKACRCSISQCGPDPRQETPFMACHGNPSDCIFSALLWCRGPKCLMFFCLLYHHSTIFCTQRAPNNIHHPLVAPNTSGRIYPTTAIDAPDFQQWGSISALGIFFFCHSPPVHAFAPPQETIWSTFSQCLRIWPIRCTQFLIMARVVLTSGGSGILCC